MFWLLQCVQMVVIYDDIQVMLMGYNILVGDMGMVFFGGQKQWVMLVWVLYKKLCILFFDEVISYFDVYCEQWVNVVICVLCIICIMVVYWFEIIVLVDCVIVFGQGKVSFDESIVCLVECQVVVVWEQV